MTQSGHRGHLSRCRDFYINGSHSEQAIGAFFPKATSCYRLLFADPLAVHLFAKIRRPALLPNWGQLDVRFGSLADLLTDFSLMAAFAWKADVPSWSIL